MSEQFEPRVIAQRIRNVLAITPRITPSMLQIGIGTYVKPAVWRPVLQEMIAEHEVRSDLVIGKAPGGNDKAFEILSLTSPLSNEE